MLGEIGDLGADAVAVFRAAGRRLAVEIELARIDVRHVREALAQRVEADHVGVDLTEAHRHGVDAFLQLRAQVGDLLALIGEHLAPLGRIAVMHGRAAALAELHAESERGTENSERQDPDHTKGHRMRQIQLPCPTFTLRKQNQVHASLLRKHRSPRVRCLAGGRKRAGVDRPVVSTSTLPSLARASMAASRAGNPAVIAPRCRPVALRPRLSVGFASISAVQYAQTTPSTQP